VLIDLHRQPAMPGLPAHGLDQWLEELRLFPDWYCPALDLAVDADAYLAAWRAVLAPVAADGLAPVTVLRDFHAENIMLVAGRDGIRHFGLLDFQDAVAGHPAYDLASVLEDARRDVTPAIETAMIARYRGATGQGAAFDNAYWALAAQRNTRILGVFTRLWKRDAKPGYKAFQPRMWGLLERDLAHPALAPVRDWFDANVPAGKRAAAWKDGLPA
jgi:aminoglycoside/choline kinase family phosphotransferase